MNESELIRKLNSVGKKVFVEYFGLFESCSKGKTRREFCIERLVEDHVSNENGAGIRCGNAKIIFDNNAQNDALLTVINSIRLSQAVIKQAQKILRERIR